LIQLNSIRFEALINASHAMRTSFLRVRLLEPSAPNQLPVCHHDEIVNSSNNKGSASDVFDVSTAAATRAAHRHCQ
jgi:hypothetical protein